MIKRCFSILIVGSVCFGIVYGLWFSVCDLIRFGSIASKSESEPASIDAEPKDFENSDLDDLRLNSAESSSSKDWLDPLIISEASSGFRPIGGEGDFIETRIVEARFHERWLRVETRHSRGSDGRYNIVGQVPMVADRLLLRTIPVFDRDEMDAILEPMNARVESVFSNPRLFRIRISDFRSVDDITNAVSRLQSLADTFSLIEPDYLVRAAGRKIPNDWLFDRQEGLDLGSFGFGADIDAPEAWEIGTDASSVVIAVVDSGLRTSHEDLDDNLWTNPGEIFDGLDNDGNGIVDDVHGMSAIVENGDLSDPNGHGSHVAGIAGAEGNNQVGIAGVAWKTRLMGLQFLNEEGVGTTSDAIECIEYAIDRGADILNLSWGGEGRSSALELVLNRASDEGILIATAAGNEGVQISSTPNYPAGYRIPNQLVVVSSDRRDELSFFSNYDAELAHLAAPEGSISVFTKSDSSYSSWSGTSMSAGFVSGAMALLKAEFPEESASWVIERLLGTVDLRDSLRDKTASGGRLNLRRAMAGEINVPFNDMFADAKVIGASGGVLSGSLALATMESGEVLPSDLEGGATVWFSWTAVRASLVQLELTASGFAGELALYRGDSLQTLERIDVGTTIPSGRKSEVLFESEAGVEYYIQIGKRTTYGGAFTVQLAPSPVNDRFEYSNELSGEAFEVKGSNRFATFEDDEMRVDSLVKGGSVWYRWTAPSDGSFYVKAKASELTFINIFQGEALSELVEISSQRENGSPARRLFDAKSGEQYYFLVASGSPQGVDFDLTGEYLSAPKISAQPSGRKVVKGESAVFSVSVFGTGTPVYAWYFNDEPLIAESGRTLVVDSVEEEDVGTYHVRIKIAGVKLKSQTVNLTISKGDLRLLSQPGGKTGVLGEELRLKPSVLSVGGETFQWFRNGVAVDDQTDLELILPDLAIEDQGFYHLEVEGADKGVKTRPVFIAASERSQLETLHLSLGDQPQLFFEKLDYLNGYFLSYDDVGRIRFSIDGSNWMSSVIPFQSKVYNIIFDGSKYLAATGYGLFESIDLLHWYPQFQEENHVGDIAFGDGKWVALLEGGRVAVSIDGDSWNITTLAEGSRFDRVAYSDGRFIGAGFNGLFESKDGVAWSKVGSNISLWTISDFRFDSGTWWAVVNSDLMYSKDLFTWEQLPQDYPSISDFSLDRATGDAYVPLGEDGLIRISGGIIEQVSNAPVYVVAAHEGRIVVGRGGVSSTSLIEDYRYMEADIRTGAWFGGSPILALGSEFVSIETDFLSILVRVSEDGSTWRMGGIYHRLGSEEFSDEITFGNGVYLSETHIGASISTMEPHSLELKSLEFGNGVFVGFRSAPFYSQDGIHWEEGSSEFGEVNPEFVKFVHDRFIGLDYGHHLMSIDGKAWSRVSRDDTVHGIRPAMAYGNGLFVMLANEKVLLSEDGLNYTASPLPQVLVYGELMDITFRDGRFLLSHTRGILESVNGVDWTLLSLTNMSPTRFLDNGNVLLGTTGDGPVIIGNSDEVFPMFRVTAPADGSLVSAGSRISLKLEHYIGGEQLESSRVYLNGSLFGTFDGDATELDLGRLAAGEYGIEIVLRDTDGKEDIEKISLRAVSSPSPESFGGVPILYDIAEYNGIAYGSGNGGVVYFSFDGREWHSRQTPTPENLGSIIVAENGLCILIDGGGIIVSYNGFDWTYLSDFVTERDPVRTSGKNQSVFKIPGVYNSAYVSVNGYDWFYTRNETSNLGYFDGSQLPSLGMLVPSGDTIEYLNLQGRMESIESLKDKVVIDYLDDDGVGFVITETELLRSFDKREWAPVEGLDFAGLRKFSRIFKVGDRYFISVEADFYSNVLGWVSEDGVTWTRSKSSSSLSGDVVYRNGDYYMSSTSDFFRSNDGINWERIGGQAYDEYGGREGRLIATPFGFVSLSSRNGSTPFFSNDGNFWESEEPTASFKVRTIIETETSLLATVDRAGRTLKREDAGEWQEFETSMSESVVFGNGKFFNPGGSGKYGLSDDGLTWSYLDYPSWYTGKSVSAFYDGEKYFWFRTEFSEILGRSANGVDWEQLVAPSSVLRGLTNFKEYTFFMGWDLHRSGDIGASWEIEKALPEGYDYVGLATTDVRIAILGGKSHQDDIVYLSKDGENWTKGRAPEGELQGIVSDEKKFYVKGKWIWSSLDGLNWKRLSLTGSREVLLSSGSRVFVAGDDSVLRELTERGVEVVSIETEVSQVGVGERIPIIVTVRNSSDVVESVDWENWLQVFVSNRSGSFGSFSDKVNPIRNVAVSALSLEPGESAAIETYYTIPDRLPFGDYYIGASISPLAFPIDGDRHNDTLINSGSLDFEIPESKLTVAVSGAGRIESSQSIHSLSKNEKVVLIARPIGDQQFVGWSGDVQNQDGAALTLVMDKDMSVTAEFGVTYQGWADNRFSLEELADESISGTDADPDGNGLSNLVEFVSGIRALDEINQSNLGVFVDEEWVCLRYVRSKVAHGYSLLVEASEKMEVWSALRIEESLIYENDTVVLLEARVSIAGQGAVYFRTKIVPDSN